VKTRALSSRLAIRDRFEFRGGLLIIFLQGW
jgi:hypothetical protein